MSKRLVTLSGPSSVGKGAITGKLRQLAPKLGLSYGRPVLYTSRAPRLGEVEGREFHFRSREEIAALPDDRYVHADVRVLLQALDMQEVRALLAQYNLVLAEVYHTFCPGLVQWTREHFPECEVVRVFIVPFSAEELASRAGETGQANEEIILEEMKRRLTARRAAGLSDESDEELLIRAQAGVAEMQWAAESDVVIVNRHGEDSPLWHREDPAAWPEGEARDVLERLIDCLTPGPSPCGRGGNGNDPSTPGG